MARRIPNRPRVRPRFPSARGARLAWRDLPVSVRDRVESKIGAKVTSVRLAAEGFSPAFAGVVTDATGHRQFVKVVGSSPNPDALAIYRQEVRNLRRLPSGLPTPKLLWSFDRDGWVALAFEAVAGSTPRLPWRSNDLRRVFAAWSSLSEDLTPAPPGFSPFASRHRSALRGWRTLAAEADRRRVRAGAPFGRWWVDHLGALARVERTWPSVARRGSTLLHSDLRADNILLTPRRVVFVDWPHACVGPGWIDPLLMLPSVAMQGGPEPWELWGRIPGTEEVDPDDVRTLLVAVAGFFVERSMRPAPPGLPTLRGFQRAQGVQALRWLRRMW